MKVIAYCTNGIDNFELLNEDELSEIRGGGTPKSRDKDIFDFEDE